MKGARWMLPVALLLMLIVAACTSSSPTATLEPTATAGPQFSDPVIQAGYNVFVSTGCSACHGQNAEGTTFAPALTGHTEAQVLRQVRAPVGIMPVFPPDKISASELQDLAAYITSLEGGHAHDRPVDPGADLEMHHWMAFFAIQDDNAEEAIHHVEHIMELVSGDHLARMQNVLTELQAGNLHGAGHEIVEGMLAGVIDDGASAATMHLNLALSPIRIDDAETAAHHLGHFVEAADAANLEAGNEILALVQAGNLTEAEHELIELLEAMGVAVEGHDDDDGSMDQGMDMDADNPLQEALEAIEAGDLDTAATELGHFIESATGMDLIKAEEALRLLQAGSLHDAEDAIGEMLGIAHN